VLQISSYWQPGEFVTINLLPDCHLDDFLNEQRSEHPNQSLKNTRDAAAEAAGGVPAAAGANSGRHAKTAQRARAEMLVETLTAWRVQPNGTEGYRTAEVTLGGVDTTNCRRGPWKRARCRGSILSVK
jgi:predicted flavoprotein YhiN